MKSESKRKKLVRELRAVEGRYGDCEAKCADDETESDLTIPMQYAAFGKGYTPTGKTIRKIPPGIYRFERVDGRTIIIPAAIVTDKLIRFPDTKSDFLIEEIFKFWKSRERFEKLGFAFRRGFMIWGPQGSGKTAAIKIVTNEMVKRGGIVVMGDCHTDLLIIGLSEIRVVEPDRPIVVLMEDIDAIIERSCESTVLALLDGEYSIDNVVFLATTNYPEKLDPRVVNRPSRFDRIVHIGMPNAASRKLYLESRNLGLNAEELEKWVKDTEGLSIAHIKELICDVFCFDNPFETELKRLKSMFKTPKSDDQRKAAGFGGPTGCQG